MQNEFLFAGVGVFFTQSDVKTVEFVCFLNGFGESEIKKRKALAKVQYLPIIHHH